MDARLYRAAFAAASLAFLGASYRTPNFVVQAPTTEIATQVGTTAEEYRRDLALEWLGQELPNWSRPCPITVQVGDHLGAGGATSFVFDRGEVFGWKMDIQGPLDRVLDSVLPHEVNHTIFASYFRRPLPRWADEGACTTVEFAGERQKHKQMLVQFLQTRRGIPFSQMLVMKEYPRDILPLYAQGHSLCTFLLEQGGKRQFLTYVAAGLEDEQWADATRQHYGYANLTTLQNTWLDWVKAGSPIPVPVNYWGRPENLTLASNTPGQGGGLTFRGQNDDPAQPLAPLAGGPRGDAALGSGVALASAALEQLSPGDSGLSIYRGASTQVERDLQVRPASATSPAPAWNAGQQAMALPDAALDAARAAATASLPGPQGWAPVGQPPAPAPVAAPYAANEIRPRRVLIEWSRTPADLPAESIAGATPLGGPVAWSAPGPGSPGSLPDAAREFGAGAAVPYLGQLDTTATPRQSYSPATPREPAPTDSDAPAGASARPEPVYLPLADLPGGWVR